MNKINLLEDMKKDILSLIEFSEMPEEIKQKLQSYCNVLKDIVARYNSNPENVFEYIDLNFTYVENMLGKLQDDKKDDIASEIIHKCRKMEQSIEEGISDNKQKDIDEFHQIVTGKNVTITDKIIGNFSDYIRDVSSRASNMLEQRGYSDETIYSQIIEIKQLIAKIQSSKEEQEIFECLEQSDKNLLDKVLEKYDAFQQSTITKEENENNGEKDFIESLHVGVPSLEKQRQNSVEFLKKQEHSSENEQEQPISLDTDIIVELLKGLNVDMDKNYTFEMMWEDLNNGYEIHYTYVRNRYLLFKTAQNCYTQKLLSNHSKNAQPRMSMLTLKRVREMFPDMEDVEYKVGVYEEK